MRVEVVESFDALTELRDAWDAVYAADPEAQYFLSWTWCAGWFERLQNPWIVLAVRQEGSGEYVGFLPLQLRLTVGPDDVVRNELRSAGGTFAGYNGLICRPDVERDVVRALADGVKRMNWAAFHQENVAMSPARLRLFMKEFPASSFKASKNRRADDGNGIDHDIYLKVELPDDWEAFLSGTLGSATRKNARRALRAVESGGDLRVTHATAETLERDLGILLGFWSTQWTGALTERHGAGLARGLYNGYQHMLAWCAREDDVFLPVLWRGDTPLAAQANLLDRKNRSVISFIAGRDTSVARPSPTFTLDMYAVRWAIRNGYRVFDLQSGDFPYKYDLGAVERRVECLRLGTRDGRNLGGRLDPHSLGFALAMARAARREEKPLLAERFARAILDADPDCEEARQLLHEVAPPPAPALPLLKPGPTSLADKIAAAIQKTQS